MNELALFAGAGGGILGGALLGWTTVCAVEIEPYPRKVLLHQQELGNLPRFPIWDDVSTFDGKPWRGLIDVVSGGFPCQDISSAGKGAGITGPRSGLWSEMHRIIREVQPRYAFMENSPMLTSRGLGRVLGDLAEGGYDAAWMVLGAADVGAPHRRKRIWILAVRNADSNHETTQQAIQRGPQAPQSCRSSRDGNQAERDIPHTHRARCAQTPPKRPDSKTGRAEPCGFGHVPNANMPGREQQWRESADEAQHPTAERCGWWRFEPRVGRVADGVAARVDRLKCLGNGQVPLVAATAFQILKHRLDTINSI